MADLGAYENLPLVSAVRALIRRWWKLELQVADVSGGVPGYEAGRITPPGNEYCRHALFSHEGLQRCAASVREAVEAQRSQGAVPARRASVHRCHLGFEIALCPVELDGRVAGYLFTGGAARDDLDAEAQAALAEGIHRIGLRPDPDAAASIPILRGPSHRQLQDLIELAAQDIEATHAGTPSAVRIPDLPADERLGHVRMGGIVGTSPPMQRLYRLIEKIVGSDATVLVTGESGTGKELVARAIHLGGPRARRPFVVQNCSAFNDNLLESALFGHVRGAFTGAVRERKGLFEAAHTGSFFLDEVGDMSPALQTKLLRVLQEGTLTPLGSNTPREVDVRIIAATHKDLGRLVSRGEFREDLFYRLNVIRVDLPPLRERTEDLPILVEHFLRKHHRGSARAPRLTEDAIAALRRYSWPGNIRELENEIERLLVLAGDVEEATVDLLSPRVREAEPAPEALTAAQAASHLVGTLHDAVEALEREMIREGLIRTGWNKSRLAKDLGISRSSLIAKVQQYGLDRPGLPDEN